MLRERPADHPAARQVDDRRQVGPTLPGRDVGDVADIAPVDLGARPEVALDEVPGPLGVRVDDRGLAPAFLAAALEAGATHEAGDPALAAAEPLLAKHLVNPGRSVGALGLGVDGCDLLGELGIGHLAL